MKKIKLNGRWPIEHRRFSMSYLETEKKKLEFIIACMGIEIDSSQKIRGAAALKTILLNEKHKQEGEKSA